MHRSVRRHCGPNYSRRIDLLHCLPLIDVDLAKRAEVTRTHPELLTIPGQRLRRDRWRRKSFSLLNCRKFHHAERYHRECSRKLVLIFSTKSRGLSPSSTVRTFSDGVGSSKSAN